MSEAFTPDDPVRKLVRNEGLKLSAGYFNTLAAASFTVGALGPVVAAFYGVSGAPAASVKLIIGAVIWSVTSLGLHLAARFILRGLKP